MSAHFAVLREADLVDADKQGTTITYRLKLSVLEDALLGFSSAFGIGAGDAPPAGAPARPSRKETPS
jgi:hypothetical protein